MKKFISLCIVTAALFLFAANTNAQVSTNGSSGLLASYPDLTTAITALNAATITSPVLISVDAANPQTAPAGGYNITATGTAANTITFTGNGNTITAGVQVANGTFDAVFKIAGGDYITIQGFAMIENPLNNVIVPATNTMTEFGVLLVHASATDGAQNNTIQNNTITLNTTYTNSVGVFSTSASSTANAALDATSTAGTNSNNKVYGNTITAAYGVEFICPPITATVFETGNDIGGSSLATGNIILFGNVTAQSGAWNRSTSTNQAGIMFRNGAGVSARFNSITSNVGTYVGAAGLNGIQISSGTAPTGVTYTTTFSDNTINLSTTGVALVTGIDFGHGLATNGTMVGSNNVISITQNAGAAVSAALIGIKGNYVAGARTFNANRITFTQSQSAGATTSAVTGITAAAVGTTVDVNNGYINIVQNAPTGAGSYGSGAITFIDVNAASGNITVTNDTMVTASSTIRSTGSLICVNQNSTTTGVNTYKNNIVNIDRVAASGSVFFTSSTNTPSQPVDSVSSNSITFTSLAGSTTCTAISCLGGPTGAGTKNICNNTISITGTNTGTTTGISWGYSIGPAGGRFTGNNITINNAAPTVLGITGGGTSSGALALSNNTLSLTSSTTSPTLMSGITCPGTGPWTVTNNTFTTLAFTGVITGAPTMNGITLSTGTGNIISDNVVTNMTGGAATSTATVTMNGIASTAGTSTSIFRNKIYGLTTPSTSATTLINGILLSGGTTVNVYNNLIGGLTPTATANTDAVRGISVTSATASATYNVMNNSVYLNASSAGVNFGTTGIFHTTSTTSTTAALVLRNNVIINNSTFAGTGLVVAFRRSSGAASTLANYSSTSNNNIFYAGTPGANNLIYSDGTSTAQTIAAYKSGVFTAGTIAPRDANSFSENTTFMSTTPSSSNFMKPDSTIATLLESGAQVISSPAITNDYAGVARYPNAGYPQDPGNPATNPDIGAREFGGIPIDLAAPNISYTSLTNTGSLTDRILANVAISDVSGVPVAGILQPRIYYKKNAGSYFSSQGSLTSGTSKNGQWSFTIVNADMGGVTVADVVSYFVIAQDVNGFIASNPGAGLVASDVNTVTTPPTTPNTYTINQPPLSGIYTVGTALFRPIGGGKLEFETRTRQVQRKILASTDAASVNSKTETNKSKLEKFPEYKDSDFIMTTVDESYQVPMVNGVEYTGSLYHEFTSQERRELGLTDAMVGAYATIAAAAADFNSRGVNGATVFSLTDASYAEGNVIFNNGSDAQTSASNTLTLRPAAGVNVSISSSQASLPIIKTIGLSYFTINGNPFGAESMSITNSNATAPLGIHISSSGTTTITQDTVKNVTVVGGLNSGTTTSAIGITISDQVAGGFGNGYGNGIVVTNCTFQKTMFGALCVGGSTVGTNNMTNISFTNNNCATSGANCIGFCAFGMQGTNGGLISQNTIANFETVSSIDHRGIWLPTAAKNVVVERNNINTLGYTGTSGYGNYGVLLTTGETASNNIIRNNVIADLWGDGWTHLTVLGDNTHGIYATGTQTGIKIYNNSISLGRNTLNQTDALTTGICLGTGSTADIRNNSIVNNAGLLGATGYGSTCIYLQTAASQLENSNYNNLYDNATGSGVKLAGKISTTNYATLALYKAATLMDASSVSGDPAYTSATNLFPDITNANSWTNAGNGVPGLVTNDYNGTARSTTVAGGAVDIGAYEFTPSATPPSVTGSPAAPPVGGGQQSFTSNGKLLALIDWGATGTNPTSISFTFYPGTNPPGSSGFNVNNGYWVITVPDGSSFTYDLTLYYDPAQLGTIPADTNVVICKSENGGAVYSPFLVYGTGAGQYERNSAQHKIIVHGLTSFSTFALGDNNVPMPVELASFTSSVDRRNVDLKWSTVSELNNAGFDIERKLTSAQTWSKIGNVSGHGTVNTVNNYNFQDKNVETGKYNYRLKQIDNNGNFNYYQLSSAVDVGVPSKFDLSQNYPNPFNPTTKINYDLPFDSKVSIRIFDMTGKEVATVINTAQTAGYYTVQFNASNLASGVYFYNITAEGGNAQKFVTTKKMVLVK